MGFEQNITLLKEYFDLCNKRNLKFPWSFEGLMKNPQNIKINLVRKSILELRESHITLKEIDKKSISNNNKNTVKKISKNSGFKKLKPSIKNNKSGMHLTVADLGKRPKKDITRGKKKSHSKRPLKGRRGGDKGKK